jgi:hypothetical protein
MIAEGPNAHEDKAVDQRSSYLKKLTANRIIPLAG